MEIPTLIRKLSGLSKLALDQTGTPEGDNARRQMELMAEKAGVKITPEQLAYHEVSLDSLNELDGDLAAMLGEMTNTEASKLKMGGKIKFKGIRVCVEEAERHFIRISQGMNRMAAFTSMGYLAGAIGPTRFMEYVDKAQGAGNASDVLRKTLEDSEEETKKFNAFDETPTDQESGMMKTVLTNTAEVQLWKSLKT